MNDAVLRELKSVVEQSVQPVRATFARKRRMREELLAHLVSIFEEEVGTLGDEQAALDETKRRFGDPETLSEQLQKSVPRRDRLLSLAERLGYQPGESIWHVTAKHLLATLAMYAIALLVALPMTHLLYRSYDLGTVGGHHSVGTVLAITLVVVPFNCALSVFFAVLLNRVGRILVGKRGGRVSLAVLCGLASLFLLTGLPAVVLLILMTRQVIEEWRYQEAWA
jgi:hypothetical protein